ncbi:MAG: hypothetical protein OXF05_01255, partial [Hyphomicrobiales bacterium]|nr:hypothetical protein [Hyphomicrobiales bacterium]
MNLFHSATVVVSAVTKSPPPPPPNLIRGGRLRKTSKGLISFAPFLAGASALALGALLSTTSPVEAGSCSTANQPAGTARCADTADPSDGTETLTTPANGSFTVTDAPGFGLDVQAANSKGIVVNSHADNTNTDISVDLDGNVKATDNALEIDQDGTGATTVTMDGTLTSTGGAGFFANVASTATGAVMLTTAGITAQGHGIRLVKYQGSGATTITANGDIDAEDRAISITDRGAGNLSIIASGALDGHGGGMRVNKGPTGTGAIDIRASGGITSANGRGIYTSNPSLTGGSINIDTTGGAVQAKTQGVQVGHDGVGAITITTDDVTSTDEEGIRAISSTNQTGNFEITANGNVTGGKQGISADNRGTGALTVTTGSSSVVTSNTAEGINAISSTAQTGNFEITANGNVTGATHGILATNAGSGALMVTTGAGSVVTSTSSGTHYAIHAVVDQHIAAISSLSQVMTITVNGDIGTSSSDSRGGIWARHSGLGNLNVTVNGDVFSGLAGVHAYHSGRGNIDVAINGAVNGGTHGVRVNHHQNDSNGNLPDNTATVALNNNVEGDIGLLVDIRDAGNSSMITVGRTDGTAVTVTGTDGTAVDLDGAGSHSFTLRSGATLAGGIDASGATGGTTLDISGAISATGGAGGDAIKFDGAGNHTVILRGGADITGRIEKGTAGNVAIRIEGDLTANPIRWSNRSTQASANSLNNFDGGDSIVIADNSRVEFATGTGLNAIPVDLHGRLVFSGISDTQQVQLAVLRGMGGEIEMDINFANGDRERSSARLQLNNLHNSAMRIPVNVRAFGGFPKFNENLEFIDTTLDTDGDGSITIGQVIQTHGIGNLGEEHFVRGVVLDNGIDDGNWVLELVCIGCDDPLATPTWSVRATPTLDAGTGGGPGGPAVPAGPATLFDTLPAVLAHLGQPESMHARTRNR